MDDKPYPQVTLRLELIKLLGGKCGCTGEQNYHGCWHKGPCQVDDIRVLQKDHINGGGYLEQKNYNTVTILTYYLNHPEQAKKFLQCLCANCNWVKKVELKENPRMVKLPI